MACVWFVLLDGYCKSMGRLRNAACGAEASLAQLLSCCAANGHLCQGHEMGENKDNDERKHPANDDPFADLVGVGAPYSVSGVLEVFSRRNGISILGEVDDPKHPKAAERQKPKDAGFLHAGVVIYECHIVDGLVGFTSPCGA
jgi:hypothetical protein